MPCDLATASVLRALSRHYPPEKTLLLYFLKISDLTLAKQFDL